VQDIAAVLSDPEKLEEMLQIDPEVFFNVFSKLFTG
jgi:hypothetical protein